MPLPGLSAARKPPGWAPGLVWTGVDKRFLSQQRGSHPKPSSPQLVATPTMVPRITLECRRSEDSHGHSVLSVSSSSPCKLNDCTTLLLISNIIQTGCKQGTKTRKQSCCIQLHLEEGTRGTASSVRIICFGLQPGGSEVYAVAHMVEALRYQSEGRGFDSRWCHWNSSLT